VITHKTGFSRGFLAKAGTAGRYHWPRPKGTGL